MNSKIQYRFANRYTNPRTFYHIPSAEREANIIYDTSSSAMLTTLFHINVKPSWYIQITSSNRRIKRTGSLQHSFRTVSHPGNQLLSITLPTAHPLEINVKRNYLLLTLNPDKIPLLLRANIVTYINTHMTSHRDLKGEGLVQMLPSEVDCVTCIINFNETALVRLCLTLNPYTLIMFNVHL